MRHFLKIILPTLFFLSFSVVFAEEATTYVPMVGVPELANSGSLNSEQYIEAIYKLAIAAGAILAVLQIIYGGVTYMFDGIVTHKEAGKKKIYGAIFGLLIILSAVLILQTINPELIKLKIFTNAPSVESRTSSDPKFPPAKIGDRVSSTDAAKIAAMKKTCPGTVSTITVSSKVTQVGCFAAANSVNAQVGDTYDGNLFAPSERAVANNKFATSCETNGGSYQDNFGPDKCISQVTFGAVTIGSSVNLSGRLEAEQAKLRLHYFQNCTGTISEANNKFGGTTLRCL